MTEEASCDDDDDDDDDGEAPPSTAARRVCGVCAKAAKGNCSRCKKAYCGRECQRSDWRTHRIVCAVAAAERCAPPAKKKARPVLSKEEEEDDDDDDDDDDDFFVTCDLCSSTAVARDDSHYSPCCGGRVCTACRLGGGTMMMMTTTTRAETCPLCALAVATTAREWIEHLERRCALGDAEAMFTLGEKVQDGRLGCAVDAKRAHDLFAAAAALGHGEGTVAVAFCARNGVGCRREPRRAAELYARAFQTAGHALAATNLGQMHLAGEGVLRSAETAAQWFAKAAARGEPNALGLLAAAYATGDGVPKDLDEARRLYALAARGEPQRGEKENKKKNIDVGTDAADLEAFVDASIYLKTTIALDDQF